MSPRLPKGILASSQGYLCLPCLLHHVSLCKCFNPRYQHVEASQLGKHTPEASLVSLQPNQGHGSKDSAENAAGSQAAKLHRQQQFAENRRENMEKLGLRQTTQTQAEKTEGSGKSQPTDPTGKEEAVKLSRRRRSQRPKSSVSALSPGKPIARSAAPPTSNTPKKATSGVLSHQQAVATDNQGPPGTDSSLNLHAYVQKLKKTLQRDDKKKRAAHIRLSTLEAPKDQAQNIARKVHSRTSRPASARPASARPAAMTKSGLVNKVKNGRRESMTTKKFDQTPVRVPPRTGSGQNAVIEMVNATALEISGNISCVIMALIQNLIITAVEVDQPPVPSLSFGLERVLFKSVSFPSLAF